MTLPVLPTAGLDDENMRRRVREVINALISGNYDFALFPAGTLSAPGLAAASSPDAGFYFDSTNGVVRGVRLGSSTLFFGSSFAGSETSFAVKDGIPDPGASTGYAKIYVDSADGDLKVKFGDGVTKTIATDT